MSPRAAARLAALGFARVHDYVAGKADWGAFGCRSRASTGATPAWAAHLREDASSHDVCVVIDGDGVLLGLLGRRALVGDLDGAVEAVLTAARARFGRACRSRRPQRGCAATTSPCCR